MNALFRRMMVLSCLSLLPLAGAQARKFVELQIGAEMQPELKEALARVMAPQAADSELLASVQSAIPFPDTVRTDSAAMADFASLVRAAGVGCKSDSAATNIDSACTPVFKLSRGIFKLQGEDAPIVVDEAAYYAMEPDSELLRTYGNARIAAKAKKFGGVLVKVPGQVSAAISPGWPGWSVGRRRPIQVLGQPTSGMAATDESVASALDTIRGDLDRHGFSARTFAISEQAAAADIDRLRQLLAANPNNAVARGLISERARSFEIDYPESAVVRTAAGGACSPMTSTWPMDVTRVSGVLSRNAQVLADLGVRRVVRSNIVVIDSGVSPQLVAHADFGRMLFRNPMLMLNPARFVRAKDGSSTCWNYLGGERLVAAHGYAIDKSVAADACVGDDPAGFLAPPANVWGDSQYKPEHGGVVATVAMGGVDLIRVAPVIENWLGVSFARIMRASPDGVQSDPTDIADAITKADSYGATVINVSLRARDNALDAITAPLRKFVAHGLVVASAGNSGGELTRNSGTFPASAVGPVGSDDGLIIVGGVEPVSASPSTLAPWDSSAWSNAVVDIAAAAVYVKALDQQGGEQCYTGTSVAAPQVSFVAALLTAFGYPTAQLVKRRILATASEQSQLSGRVTQGRVLQVAHALDVFVDQVWLAGAEEPLRVQILSTEAMAFPGTIINVCDPPTRSATLGAVAGWIDPARLVYWNRRGASEAEIWYEEGGGISPLGTKCPTPGVDLRIRERVGGQLKERSIPLSGIQRIVPTRFRAAIPLAL